MNALGTPNVETRRFEPPSFGRPFKKKKKEKEGKGKFENMRYYIYFFTLEIAEKGETSTRRTLLYSSHWERELRWREKCERRCKRGLRKLKKKRPRVYMMRKKSYRTKIFDWKSATIKKTDEERQLGYHRQSIGLCIAEDREISFFAT